MRKTRKTDISHLSDMPFTTFTWPHLPSLETGLYQYSLDGFEFDFLYKKSDDQRLFVFFCGNANRNKLSPPVFQRWTWADYFPGHCIFISDPTIKLFDDLGLAWYLGTAHVDLYPYLTELIKKIAEYLRISLEKVIFYGSSGGGFASLRMLSFIPEAISVAINPQIDITLYEKKLVEKFLNRCFYGMNRQDVRANYHERFTITRHYERIKSSKIIYVQNREDTHHYEVHLPLFLEKFRLNSSNDFSTGNIELITFENKKGHNAAESKSVLKEVIEKVLKFT